MISKTQIESGDYVPNAAIRELVERCIDNGELEAISDLTVALGLGRHASTSLKRKLGILPHSGSTSLSQYVRYDIAVGIVRYLDRYPVDYGV